MKLENKPFFFVDYISDKQESDIIEEGFVIERIFKVNNVSQNQIKLLDFGYTKAMPIGIILVAHWVQKN